MRRATLHWQAPGSSSSSSCLSDARAFGHRPCSESNRLGLQATQSNSWTVSLRESDHSRDRCTDPVEQS